MTARTPLLNSGPAQGMGAMATSLMVAVLASSFGGAEAQYNPDYAPHSSGETFGNDEIYEKCRVLAHQACLEDYPIQTPSVPGVPTSSTACRGKDDTAGYSYKFYQLGCQFYNQGYERTINEVPLDWPLGDWPCCGFNQCRTACNKFGDLIRTDTERFVRSCCCLVRCAKCHAAPSSFAHMFSLRLLPVRVN